MGKIQKFLVGEEVKFINAGTSQKAGIVVHCRGTDREPKSDVKFGKKTIRKISNRFLRKLNLYEKSLE